MRTSMNAIIGFNDLLADGDLTPEQFKCVDIICSSGKSLLNLINDILDLSIRREADLPMTHFMGKVLVAEDIEASQILMRSLLTQLGLDVTVVGTGTEVLTEVKSQPHPFDLILMDIQMPQMHGYEAAQALRKLGCGVPIVALTANAMKGDDEKCLEAGCNDYLAMPIDRSELLACSNSTPLSLLVSSPLASAKNSTLTACVTWDVPRW